MGHRKVHVIPLKHPASQRVWVIGVFGFIRAITCFLLKIGQLGEYDLRSVVRAGAEIIHLVHNDLIAEP